MTLSLMPRPLRLTLPSGRRVALHVEAARAPGPAGSLGALERFEAGDFRVATESGESMPIGSLPVADFQVLRAVLTARGHLAEPAAAHRCANCGASSELRASDLLELGPYLDGDLGHDGLDAPFPYGDELAVEAPPGRGSAGEAPGVVVLRPVTVDGARPVFAAAAGGGVVEPTTAIVAALGVERLGDERDPGRIARRLRQAPGCWSDLTAHVDRAWYPARLAGWARCDECGVGASVEAPSVKEFPPDPDPAPATDEPFPDADAFAARVERLAAPILRRRGERGVELIVEPGPAACDDGGVALLGSYDPPETGDHGVIAHGAQVRLYHRTFRALHVEEGPYDLDAEIVETLEHELDHHDAWRRGDDPVDDEERAAIVDEERVRVGDTEALRRASRATRHGALDFARRTWPLWLVLALAALAEAYGR